MLNNIFKNSGFAAGVRSTGYLILGLLILANVLVSTNYDPAHKAVPKPKMSMLMRDLPFVLTFLGTFFCVWGLCEYIVDIPCEHPLKFRHRYDLYVKHTHGL